MNRMQLEMVLELSRTSMTINQSSPELVPSNLLLITPSLSSTTPSPERLSSVFKLSLIPSLSSPRLLLLTLVSMSKTVLSTYWMPQRRRRLLLVSIFISLRVLLTQFPKESTKITVLRNNS
jgi:hypothetical protein